MKKILALVAAITVAWYVAIVVPNRRIAEERARREEARLARQKATADSIRAERGRVLAAEQRRRYEEQTAALQPRLSQYDSLRRAVRGR